MGGATAAAQRRYTSVVFTLTCSLSTVAALAIAPVAGPDPCDPWCLVENPSFELPGAEPGQVLAGWCNFGQVGVAIDVAVHGRQSATVSGPGTVGWDISALWQPFEAAAGDRFRITVHAMHRASSPIVGQASAIVNVEWRDGGGGLIDFGTWTLLDASSPTDCLRRFEFETGPAPAGTATARYLVGFLQSPAQESGTAVFDMVDIHRVEPVGWDDLQWVDFPGGTTLLFASRLWRVKGPGVFGPGPNFFSDSSANVWVDSRGRLHLRITQVAGEWLAAELTLVDSLGYGEYRFKVEADLDDLDPKVIFGLFLWEYQPCWRPDNWWNAPNEIDIEFGRFGDPLNPPAQFVVQPHTREGNRHQFPLVTNGPLSPTTHGLDWRHDEVVFRSWHGHADEPQAGDVIETWSYTGPDNARPEEPRVHMNLWLFEGIAPSDGREVEVIVTDFTFIALCPADFDGDRLVGITDFLFLLAAWGGPAGDLDGDCTTGITDFLQLLGAWGPC